MVIIIKKIVIAWFTLPKRHKRIQLNNNNKNKRKPALSGLFYAWVYFLISQKQQLTYLFATRLAMNKYVSSENYQ